MNKNTVNDTLDLSSKGLKNKDVKKEISVIENIENILVVNLSDNELTSIPDLSMFKNLRKLYLSGNMIKKTSNIKKLEKLKILSLPENQIESMTDFMFLTELISLSLGKNAINEIPDISSLKNIKMLDLSFNNIKKYHTSIFEHNSLKTLNLNYTKINLKLANNKFSNNVLQELLLQSIDVSLDDLLSNFLNNFNTLIKLDISSNTIGRISLGEQYNKLKYFDCSYNIFNEIPNNIYNMKYLEYLNVSRNRISKIHSKINKLNNLKIFSAYDNDIDDFMFLEQFKKLEVIDISGNYTEKIPKKLNSKLIILKIAYNDLKKFPMFDMRNLETLDISTTFIKKIPQTIIKSKLKSLNIGFTYIKKIDFIYSLSGLRNLSIFGIPVFLTENILNLKNLISLTIVNTKHEQLEDYLSKLKSLKTITTNITKYNKKLFKNIEIIDINEQLKIKK